MLRDIIHHGEKKGNEVVRHAKDSLGDLYLGMNDLFNSFFKDARGGDIGVREFMPQSEISETEKGIDLKLELPGVEEKDVNITLENNVLTINGEKKLEEETIKKNYHVTERSYGKFERVFSLPDYAETDKINARFKNGVLTIHIPKAKPAPEKTKKISISKE